jgi:hypothetical protein
MRDAGGVDSSRANTKPVRWTAVRQNGWPCGRWVYGYGGEHMAARRAAADGNSLHIGGVIRPQP